MPRTIMKERGLGRRWFRRYYDGMCKDPTREVAAAYDRWAESYDWVENPTRDLDAAAMRAQNFALAGATIVEAGCGTGKNTVWLAAQARFVTALDFSETMLERARQTVAAAGLADRVHFHHHDILAPWPVSPAEADLVAIDLVLEHIGDLAPVFREARRALRSDGVLFICEFHPARQLLGKQARFSDPGGGEIRVPAFLHDVSAFVNGAVGAGFALGRLDEWRDPGAAPDAVPRLLSLVLAKQG
jgi:ubiquinone/menaquinone biosynthesis C-methylase UbiE